MNVKTSNTSRLQSELVDAPKWYTSQELWEVLRRDESPHIANRLSVEYAKNLQMAFNKGYEIGSRKVEQKNNASKSSRLQDALVRWRACERAWAQVVFNSAHPNEIAARAKSSACALQDVRLIVDSEPWARIAMESPNK